VCDKGALEVWPELCHYKTLMMVRHQCPRCGNTGFVKAERVIKAGNGVTELSCGACEHFWTEVDEGPGAKKDEPER